jgi:hypothetical protein
VLLGQAIATGQRGFSPVALGLVGTAIAVAMAALFLPASGDGARAASAGRVVLAVGVALAFWRLPLIDLFLEFPVGRPRLAPFVLPAAIAAVLSACVVLRWPRAVQPACLPIVLVAFALMGAFYLTLSPDPKIDVYNFHRFGCQALLDGHDPYAITIPDPYVPPSHFYAPGVEVGGRILCGYCYPPLTLLMSLPAYVAWGDPRLADLFAWTAAAAVVAYGFPRRRDRGRTGDGPALLLLFTPGVFLQLQACWTESLVALLLATTAILAARRQLRAAAVAAGLLLASKQYVPLASPALLLLIPRPWRSAAAARWVGLAMAAGLIVTLPFVLWGPAAFLHSLTVMNVGVVRNDAMSFLPMLIRATGRRPPLLVCPALAAVAASVVLVWRSPRTAAGFAVGVGLTLTCAFAVSPLAFGNYYALAAAAFCVAAAAEA